MTLISETTERKTSKDGHFLIFDRINSAMEEHDFGFVKWKTIESNDTGGSHRQATYPETGNRINTLFQVRATKYLEKVYDGKGSMKLVEIPFERRNVAINAFLWDRMLKNDPDTLVFFGDFNSERPEGGMKYYGANFIKNLLVSRRETTYVLIPESNFFLFKDWKELIKNGFLKDYTAPLIEQMSEQEPLIEKHLEEQRKHELLIKNSVDRINAANKKIDEVLNNPELTYEDVVKITQLVQV